MGASLRFEMLRIGSLHLNGLTLDFLELEVSHERSVAAVIKE
jgi:hypothetical protein